MSFPTGSVILYHGLNEIAPGEWELFARRDFTFDTIHR